MNVTRTGARQEAADIKCELTNAFGKQFCDALLSAGLPEGGRLSDAFRIEEVALASPNDANIDNFTNRQISGRSHDADSDDEDDL